MTNKILDDENNEQGLLELIPGKTVIGKLEGTIDGEYTKDLGICYGNIADQVINDEFKTLPKEVYMDMLNEFLNTEEGYKYRCPSEEESNQAIEEMKEFAAKTQARIKAEKEAERKRLQEEEELQRQKQLEQERLEQERLEQERLIEEERKRLEEQKEKEERYNQEKERQRVVISEEVEEVIQDFDKQETKTNKKKKKEKSVSEERKIIKKMKWVLILSMLLLLISVLANVFLFTKSANYYNQNVGQLNINGEVYEIPLAKVDLKDGETRIIVYGISSTNKSGKIENHTIPLGEFQLIGDKLQEITNAFGDKLQH